MIDQNYRHLKIKLYFASFILAPILLGGCAATSTQYQRQNAVKGEIIWTYDRDLKATKDGKIICGSNWDSLSDAINCVPEAKRLADSARNNHKTGMILKWTGVSVLSAGLVGGTITLFNDFYKTDRDAGSFGSFLTEKGMLMIFGGLAVGFSIAIPGNYLALKGFSQALDAVNIYNCNFKNNPECRSDSTILSPDSNKIIK